MARTAACTRSQTSSLALICFRCLLTVLTLIERVLAICRLVCPCTTSLRTSTSRRVRVSAGWDRPLSMRGLSEVEEGIDSTFCSPSSLGPLLIKFMIRRMDTSSSNGVSPASTLRTAWRIWTGAACLRMYPAAPASSESERPVDASTAVRMRTRVSGNSLFMAWVAATPSISGIFRSMSTRSGHKRRQSSSACLPLAASATTSRSECPSSVSLIADLKRGWSSL